MDTQSAVPDKVLDLFSRKRRLRLQGARRDTGTARQLLAELDHLRAYFPATCELTLDTVALDQALALLHSQVDRVKDELLAGQQL